MKSKFTSPFKGAAQDGGKWGTRDPGTGWSQEEKLTDPKGHSKAVSEGAKNLKWQAPALAAYGLLATTGALLPIVKATTAAVGIGGGMELVKKVVGNQPFDRMLDVKRDEGGNIIKDKK